jgi:hypothetical protein
MHNMKHEVGIPLSRLSISRLGRWGRVGALDIDSHARREVPVPHGTEERALRPTFMKIQSSVEPSCLGLHCVWIQRDISKGVSEGLPERTNLLTRSETSIQKRLTPMNLLSKLLLEVGYLLFETMDLLTVVSLTGFKEALCLELRRSSAFKLKVTFLSESKVYLVFNVSGICSLRRISSEKFRSNKFPGKNSPEKVTMKKLPAKDSREIVSWEKFS